MKNKRRIIGVLAAAVLATIGTIALIGYVQSAKDKALAEEELVDVYVVDRLVPQGAAAATITASVSLEQVPARLQQPGAITDLDDVGDQVAASDLQPGDQLLTARLVPKDEVAEELEDKVEVAALLTAERAVGGALEPGDLVGVYLSFDPFELEVAGPLDGEAPNGTPPREEPAPQTLAEGGAPEAAAEDEPVRDEPTGDEATPTDATVDDNAKTPNMTRLEFQQVLVTNIQTVNTPVVANDREAAAEGDGPAIAQVSATQYIVTLALSPEQSERFVFATEFGHVWLASQPASVSDDGTRLVTLGNAFKVVN